MDTPVWHRARRRGIARLDLRPGDTVLDVACGTGASFGLLEERVGEKGLIVGVDASPEMLSEAWSKARRAGWQNIELIEAPVEEANLPNDLDAALFSFVHDVTRSPRALDNALASLTPGARIAAVGAKWAPWLAAPVNLVVWLAARRAVTTFEGFGRPWSLLAERVSGLTAEPIAFGGAYIASGLAPGLPRGGSSRFSVPLGATRSSPETPASSVNDPRSFPRKLRSRVHGPQT